MGFNGLEFLQDLDQVIPEDLFKLVQKELASRFQNAKPSLEEVEMEVMKMNIGCEQKQLITDQIQLLTSRDPDFVSNPDSDRALSLKEYLDQPACANSSRLTERNVVKHSLRLGSPGLKQSHSEINSDRSILKAVLKPPKMTDP